MLVNLDATDLKLILGDLFTACGEDYQSSKETEQQYQDRQDRRQAVMMLLTSAFNQAVRGIPT